MIVKATNNTIKPNVLILTLLIFDIYSCVSNNDISLFNIAF